MLISRISTPIRLQSVKNSVNIFSSQNVPSGRELLPTNVKPIKYDLTLDPNFETFKFNGNVKIDLEVQEESNYVTLNTFEIEVNSAKVGDLKATDISYNESTQTATFKFPENFTKGSSITLDLDFIGILNDNMAGFYKSSYKEDGVVKYLATTQMEPTDARRAFPSFDEPALKAIFDITLISDKHLTAISNMDIKEEKILDDGRKATSFNSTPLISTYLIAFIVGELKYVENHDFRVPIKVWATRGQESQGKFSAELISKTLAFFEKSFGIDYPFPKLDYVAIPDFSAGAMENWGAVFSREVDVLFDEENSNLATKQRVAEVVQHELAHQWFGNLVTMEWWEGLWLNEGFATWMSWYSCNEFYPDWKVWQSYISDTLQGALQLDALRSSHPIEVPVQKAEEINQIFDAISYSKGSSLLKMISGWLGEETFIRGVSNYLKKHQYGNTKTSDLWEALSEASGEDVVKVMSVWTQKVGYPVLTVTEDASSNTISVKQNRYLTTGDVKPEEDETIFPVFLGLKTKNNVDESLRLDKREDQYKIEEGLDFYKLNADQFGIYRTSYSPERWIKLGKAGVEGLLSVEDRTGLVADAGALATSGYQSTSNLLNLVHGWKEENNYVVWGEILARVTAIKNAWIFEDKATVEALEAFIRSLVETKVHSLGWEFNESDSFEDQSLKSVLFAAAAGAKDEKVVASALESFQKYVEGDKKAIHPNIRASVFGTVARTGGEKEYDQIFNIYQNPVSVDEKITALRTLGRFEDEALIQRTLSIVLDEHVVKSQDLYIPMQGLRAHQNGINALWKWAQENWDTLVVKLPPGLSMLGTIVQISTVSFTSEAKIQEIQKFFENKDTKGFNQGLAQSIDTIRSKSQWITRDSEDVNKWLSSNNFKN
ncbi:aminopeptidase 2 [Wickerhamomyces ciferrii]|uniref:Aminopeptidase n=1 Tax=Wickerhamomyces ciferrii (strain ATCC 14091 / BCRC 22168 / CBS 111 / JCM 3599 / NBRC 0793 / NRRL Y-1031 F-60-10) TaxID=1206466 RepID=K0KVH0_WICCF|nr:aminopeptidase 2 [Wickerhamomyces ciferrii]CCH45143.1 aminopeptidase 2 [Wickerhamomyces ciferrii]